MKTLTPADTRIFDDDVLEDMQARWDDTPVCGWSIEGVRCSADATHMASCSGCRRFLVLLCDAHVTEARRLPMEATHRVCGHRALLRDLLAVRPL